MSKRKADENENDDRRAVKRAKQWSKEPQIYLKKNFNERRLYNCEFSSLFQYCTLGGGSSKPQWCALRNFTGVMSSVLIRFECPNKLIDNVKSTFSFLEKFHQDHNVKVDIDPVTRDVFFKSIFTSSRSQKDMVRKLMQEVGDPFKLPEYSEGAILRPFYFILPMTKMAEFGFPMALGDDFVPTKENYKMVTESSPVYILDCEMCRNESNIPILTRVSLIDENAKIVFDTLVIPDEPIKDYCTPYSGISAESLKNVKTTLKDVQEAIIKILPEDAILCGHSIHFDLIAMKMAHPFCIDISLLFNITGFESRRTGLRNLACMFLQRNIQNSKNGHCSIEDCKATLDLFKLKLTHGMTYGNVILGFNISQMDKPELDSLKKKGDESSSEEEEESHYLYPKLCTHCGEKFAMTCPIDNCSCLEDSPKNCIKCLSKLSQPPPEPRGTIHFNFREAIQDAVKWASISLIDSLDTPMNTVMCALKNPKHFIPKPNKNCTLIDVSQFDDTIELIKKVGNECSSHRLSVIECSLPRGLHIAQFDNAMTEFINRSILKNTLCSFVFASEFRTTAFLKIKDSISNC